MRVLVACEFSGIVRDANYGGDLVIVRGDEDAAYIALASPDRILALCDDNKELRAALTDLVKWADRFSASRTIQDELALAASLDEARAALEGKPTE